MTLDEVDGVPTIISSRLLVTARVPGLDVSGFQAAVGEAAALCPVSRLFVGARVSVAALYGPHGDGTMSATGLAIVLGVFMLASCVWVGGLVAIFVVARVATGTLVPGERVAFFRGLGRAYLLLGVLALLVAFGCGAALLNGRAWDGLLIAAVAVVAALLAVLVIGVVQARRMTRLRAASLSTAGDLGACGRVRRQARAAALLGAIVGLLSLALIVLGVLLATLNPVAAARAALLRGNGPCRNSCHRRGKRPSIQNVVARASGAVLRIALYARGGDRVIVRLAAGCGQRASGVLEPALLELVKIRGLQFHCCAFWLLMHHRVGREHGENQRRLDVLPGWHEVPALAQVCQ